MRQRTRQREVFVRARRSKCCGHKLWSRVTRGRCQLPRLLHLRLKSIEPSIRYNYRYSNVITFGRRTPGLTGVHQSSVYTIPERTTLPRPSVDGCARCAAGDIDASTEPMMPCKVLAAEMEQWRKWTFPYETCSEIIV